MAVKNPSRVWKNTEGKASGGFSGQPHIPFSNFGQAQNQSENQPDQENQQQRKKRNSPTDSVKSTINAIKTGVNIARFTLNAGPIGLIFAAIAIFIIIYMLFFGGGSSMGLSGSSSDSTQQQGTGTAPTSQFPPIPGLTINLAADASVNNGSLINYTASYTYEPSKNNNTPLSQITLYDDLPQNTTFGTTSGKSTQTGTTISWLLSDNPSPITFTLKPASDDISVSNYVYATTAGGGGASSVPPNKNNCGDPGYAMEMALSSAGLNFGDPNCEVTDAYNNPQHRDTMYSYMKTLDPQNSIVWFYCIAYNEASWIPNAYAPPSTGTPNASGAWGLFQMAKTGTSNPPDVGDVYWKQQMQNAVNYNHLRVSGVADSFEYWKGGNPDVTGTAGTGVSCAKAEGPGAPQ